MKWFDYLKKNADGGANPETETGQERNLLSLVVRTLDAPNEIVYPGEVIDSLRKAISRLTSKKTLSHRLSVVSALRQEGVTYLTRAMAAVIANDLNASVCAVELNWWRPDKSLVLPEGNKGLAGLLTGVNTLEDAVLRTDHANLAILPAGKMAVADRPVWARSDHLKDALQKLGEQYEFLLLDIPAILSTNDAIPLASLGDACCLIVHQGVTSVEKVRMALDEIDHLTILGAVLNKVRISTPAAVLNIIPQDPGLETGEAAGV